MSKERTRVVMADDHACLRRATAEWLERSSNFEIVAEVGSAEEARAAAERLHPDIVVLDIDMPGETAFSVAEDILRFNFGTRIVFLSGFCNDRYVADAIKVRAAAYVTKSESPANLLEALTRVAEGSTYFSPEVRDRLVIDDRGIRLGEESAVRGGALSGREVEVLRHIAKGMTKREVAKLLILSPRTVERHVANIMAKLGIHDRVGLARYAIREGFVEA